MIVRIKGLWATASPAFMEDAEATPQQLNTRSIHRETHTGSNELQLQTAAFQPWSSPQPLGDAECFNNNSPSKRKKKNSFTRYGGLERNSLWNPGAARLAVSQVSIKRLANGPSVTGKAPLPLGLLADRPAGREPVSLSDHIMGKRSCRGPTLWPLPVKAYFRAPS